MDQKFADLTGKVVDIDNRLTRVEECDANDLPDTRRFVIAIGCAQAATRYQQAKFVEYSTFSPCHYDCQPFNVVYFNFCFQVDKQFLTGNTYAWRWEYDPSQMKPLQGSDVSIRFNHNHIWVVRTDGRELRLRRLESSTKFRNGSCNSPSR